MTHDFVGWTPPPGAVVKPPVHPETRVLCMWSDGSKDEEPRRAGSQNWSSVGDGPCVVAYAVVEEYKEPPKVARVPKDYWMCRDIGEGFTVYDAPPQTHWDCIIHVREVPDPSREVVKWAVVDHNGHVVFQNEADAFEWVGRYGGTVVKLTGVMP